MANLLDRVHLLEAQDLNVLASATGFPVDRVAVVRRGRALADMREAVALRSTRNGADLATFRKLKVKLPRW